MKNISISFFTFLNLLLLACCSKEEPCPTCFESIVTCKVNGKEWRSNCISNDPLFGCRTVRCYYYYNSGFGLDFSAINDQQNSGITLDQGSAWGGAQLGNNSIQQREFGFNNFQLLGNCTSLDSIDFSYSNSFYLTYVDTVDFLIEGNFQFKVYNLCGDTAVVTDGYFKTKFIF